MIMRKWILWITTIALVLVAGYFLIWAIQTAWLGSFPGKDKSKFTIWFILQICVMVVSLLIPVILWIKYWKNKNKINF
jgi:biotin transporter BioY